MIILFCGCTFWDVKGKRKLERKVQKREKWRENEALFFHLVNFTARMAQSTRRGDGERK
jgi:hypothetical protein